MISQRPTSSSRAFRGRVAAVAAAAGIGGAALSAPPAQAAVSPAQTASWVPASVSRELGTWNYDQPDSRTKTNMAVISCPAGSASCSKVPPITIPQVGNVDFSAGPGGSVIGRTDQGCTWKFTPRPGGLELAPGRQTCFNRVIGSSYTMTRWSVTFSGNHESEYITAVSHLSYGDFNFVLQDGRRTRAAAAQDSVGRFTGDWRYDPANSGTGLNIKTTAYKAPARQVKSALTGQVRFTAGRRGVIDAHTADGCTWTLAVAGNTAELVPARQVCTRDGASTAMSFWSIASNGRQQVSVIAGTDARGGNYLATNTSLTRDTAGRPTAAASRELVGTR